jgi:hypothetical protein
LTKVSPNPRRYSRGPEGLDPNQPLHVYMQVRVGKHELEPTVGRIEYLAEKHTNARMALASVRRDSTDVYLTLEIYMGPARAALRGTSTFLQAGYALLWDIVKTLFYAYPIFCNPPSAEERESVNHMGIQIRTNHGPIAETEIA